MWSLWQGMAIVEIHFAKSTTPLGGIPILERVIHTAQMLNPYKIHVIHGNHGDNLPAALPHLPVNWICQKEQLGTGHALLQALPFVTTKIEYYLYLVTDPYFQNTLRKIAKETPTHELGLIVAEYAKPRFWPYPS